MQHTPAAYRLTSVDGRCSCRRDNFADVFDANACHRIFWFRLPAAGGIVGGVVGTGTLRRRLKVGGNDDGDDGVGVDSLSNFDELLGEDVRRQLRHAAGGDGEVLPTERARRQLARLLVARVLADALDAERVQAYRQRFWVRVEVGADGAFQHVV